MAFVNGASKMLPLFLLFFLPTSTLATVSWTLTSTNFNQSSFEVQPYVSNGYIGQRIPVEGLGYKEFAPISAGDGTNGWPLFDPRFTAAMVAGFYDQQDNTTGTNFVRRSQNELWQTYSFYTGSNRRRATHFHAANMVPVVFDC